MRRSEERRGDAPLSSWGPGAVPYGQIGPSSSGHESIQEFPIGFRFLAREESEGLTLVGDEHQVGWAVFSPPFALPLLEPSHSRLESQIATARQSEWEARRLTERSSNAYTPPPHFHNPPSPNGSHLPAGPKQAKHKYVRGGKTGSADRYRVCSSALLPPSVRPSQQGPFEVGGLTPTPPIPLP